jgi:hypothetical protein
LRQANLRREWSTILKSRACRNKTKQQFTISRHASPHGGFLFHARQSSALFECRPEIKNDSCAILSAGRGSLGSGNALEQKLSGLSHNRHLADVMTPS